MKTSTLFSILFLSFTTTVFAQQSDFPKGNSVVAKSLAAHKDQNPFHFRTDWAAETTPSVKAVEKGFHPFDDLIDLGEDFLCLPTSDFEPATHLAKKDIIQRGNPVFDAPQKDELNPRQNPN